MKFKILTDRIAKYKNGDIVETSDNQLDPKQKVMQTLVKQGEAMVDGVKIKKVTKKVVKKLKRK